MKIVSRALRVALAGGMVAGALAVAQPSESDAVITVVGSCSGTRALATAKSSFIWPADLKNAGITDKNHDATVSAKGTHAVGGVPGTVGGACGFLQTIAADKGLTTLPAGTRTIIKWGSKTVSPVIDCVADTGATATGEWPLSGKLSYSYSDLTKTDAYVTTASPTGTASDVVVLAGIITKGVGIGARIDSAVGYTPIIKDKLQTNDWDGVGGSALASGDAIQGYATDLGNAAGCLAVVEPPVETVNLRGIMLTTNAATPLLGSPVPASSIYIGAALFGCMFPIRRDRNRKGPPFGVGPFRSLPEHPREHQTSTLLTLWNASTPSFVLRR